MLMKQCLIHLIIKFYLKFQHRAEQDFLIPFLFIALSW